MKKASEHLFAKRVHTTLGWTILLGICAGLNLAPSPSRELAFEQPAVLPPAMAPQMTRAPVMVRPGQAERRSTGQDLNKLPQRERVIAWFTQYDRIRREAQMSRGEKLNAIKLWATSMHASASDTEEARGLLTRMVNRYKRASAQMANLPVIPETQSLHAGYSAYFKRAHSDFARYLHVLDTQSTRAALSQMEQGRAPLGEIDVRNKNLDRRLRSRYEIPEYAD